MRHTRRVVTGMACVLVAAVCFGECTSIQPLKEELKNSDAVIIGTVTSSRLVPQSWYAFDGTDYLVHVDQKIKGKRTEEMTIFSEHIEGGYDLQAGRQYLLFLSDDYGHWVMNRCGNSGTMDQEEKVIRELVHLAGND